MGSLCNSASTTQQKQTSASTYSPSPVAQGYYNTVAGLAQKTAQQPYTPYTQPMTAGLTPTQTSAISGANVAAGQAQPWYQTAGQYGTFGATPVTSADIAQYMDPYTQSVINATQSQFNEDNAEQQQGVIGNAAVQGALGGNRVGVAQAELARQQKLAQDPVIANLYSTGYGNALSEANQMKQNALQGAGLFGQLGTGAQTAAEQGVEGQLTAGGVQQATNQNALSAQYQEFLRGQGWTDQQIQAVAPYLLGAAGGLGGTTNGNATATTTPPQPSLFSQIAGLGVTGLGIAQGLGWQPKFGAQSTRRGGVVSGDASPWQAFISLPAHRASNGGFVHHAGGGRTDDVPLKVQSNSFVLPADIVSAVGEGNSLAGAKRLGRVFGAHGPASNKRGHGVDIAISGGEFVVPPEAVAKIGQGDMDHGHAVLEDFVRKMRRKSIARLRRLPGPSRAAA